MAAESLTPPINPDTPATKVEEKTLVSWSAPSRPFQRRSKDFYVRLVAIAAVLGLILFIVEGFMPVLLLVALVFLYYVMSTIEPETIEYQVTNLGIKMAQKRSDWELLGRFWFTSRFGTELMVVESANFAGRMEFVIDPNKKEEIKKAVSDYLVYEEVAQSTFDKTAHWVSKHILGY